jgi:hypothetical protein
MKDPVAPILAQSLATRENEGPKARPIRGIRDQRVELSHEKTTDEDWHWDSYFLMQHHGAPTRLLD